MSQDVMKPELIGIGPDEAPQRLPSKGTSPQPMMGAALPPDP